MIAFLMSMQFLGFAVWIFVFCQYRSDISTLLILVLLLRAPLLLFLVSIDLLVEFLVFVLGRRRVCLLLNGIVACRVSPCSRILILLLVLSFRKIPCL